MKHLKILSLLFITIGLLSCSSSDDPEDNNPTIITGNYFPSMQSDQWIYNVVNSSDVDPAGNFTDTDLLTVASQSGNSFSLEANNGTSPASGTFNALLVNGTLTKTDSELTYNGTFVMPAGFEDIFNQDIVLNNLVLYDLNANNNEVLSTVSDVISEDLIVGDETFPLTINYELKTIYTGNSASETVDGVSYSNVVKTRFVLNLSVSTEIVVVVPTEISILDSQEVLTIDTFYAEDIGLIKADSQSGYQLSDEITALSGPPFNIDLGFPESGTSSNVQELDSYFLN